MDLFVVMYNLRCVVFRRLNSCALSNQFILYDFGLALLQLEDGTMNSAISVHVFNTQSVVLLVGKETDDAATAKWGSSFAQSHRQTTHLPAFAAQKKIMNGTNLYLCASLPVPLKFQ